MVHARAHFDDVPCRHDRQRITHVVFLLWKFLGLDIDHCEYINICLGCQVKEMVELGCYFCWTCLRVQHGGDAVFLVRAVTWNILSTWQRHNLGGNLYENSFDYTAFTSSDTPADQYRSHQDRVLMQWSQILWNSRIHIHVLQCIRIHRHRSPSIPHSRLGLNLLHSLLLPPPVLLTAGNTLSSSNLPTKDS